jgi:type II secretory pathway component PulF
MRLELTPWQRLKIDSRMRREWYLALAKLSKEGLPIYETLKVMHSEFNRLRHPLLPLTALVLLGLRGQESGDSRGVQATKFTRRRTLGSELKPHVPHAESLLIEAGDLSGRLHVGLESAAELLSSRLSLYASLSQALVRPLGYLMVSFVLLIFLSLRILPEFERTRPRVSWPEGARYLAFVCDHVALMGILVFLSLTLVGAGLAWFLPNATPPFRDKLNGFVFPFQLYASFHGACFLLALSAFIQAGSGFTQAVQSIRSSSTPFMVQQCNALLLKLKMGKTPSVALCELVIVHPKHHWLILVYGLSSDTPRAYQSIARDIHASVDTWIQRVLGHAMGHVLMATVGGLVFWVYWAMFAIVESVPLG